MISFDALTARAALTFGYTEEELLAKRGRSKRITMARQALMWAARYHDFGTQEIGDWMGGRDHTTIIYGSEEAAKRADSDPTYARALRAVAGLPEPAEEPVRTTTLPRGSRWWLHQAYGGRARLALAA